MQHLLRVIVDTFARFNASSVVDILIVGLIFFGILMLVRGTRADQILRGLIVLFILLALASSTLHLTMVDWLLRNSPLVLLVALPIIFQPELRRALEQVGRTSRIVNHPFNAFVPPAVRTSAVDELVEAARRLCQAHYGALIVVEGVTGLQDYVRSGTRLDATLSADLLESIFFPNSALHDGAVIVQGDRIVAAGCVLPLTDNVARRSLGTRHRAAIGITELTDAACIAISEETGTISVARSAHLSRDVTLERLEHYLTALYHRQAGEPALSVGR